MALQIDTVFQACKQIAREIRDYQKNLTIYYVVHYDGQRTEALGVAAQDILNHPASETALQILQKPRPTEQTGTLGTAVARKNILFGLATQDTMLTICAINIDEFENIKQVQRQAYHLGWHAIDAANYHNEKHGVRSGAAKEMVVRRRNAVELAMANLEADIFAATISRFHSDPDSAKNLGIRRSRDSLKNRTMYSPEFYPYAIAAEATAFAIDQVDPKAISKKQLIREALRVAHQVRITYDERNIKQWIAFCEPAQNMAWRGFNDSEILCAAINTSPYTYVRATGYLVADMVESAPANLQEIRNVYSPYADDDFNENMHRKMVEQIYQDVIAQGLRQKSVIPFWEMANKQNEALADGHIMGWCASALQEAGSAFMAAEQKGLEPQSHAAETFKSSGKDISWDQLKTLNKKIIKAQRQGHNVTPSEIGKLAQELEGMEKLTKSITKTLSDPHYKQALDAANQLGAIPKSPSYSKTPRTPAPAAAGMQPAMMPGLGKTGLGKTGTAQTQPHQVAASESQESEEQQ